MTRAKEETSKKTATYDGVCVSDTEGYDRALSFFGLDERRTPADIVRRMIDAGENTNDGCAEIQTSAHAPDCWSDTGKLNGEKFLFDDIYAIRITDYK